MSHGQFVWCELMTTGTSSATAFYRAVIGWTAEEMPVPPDRIYTVLSADGVPVAGLMEIPPVPRAAGARPGWVGYIAVDDVDAMAARVTQAGGSIHRAAEDIPGVGRFAIAADPHGAIFTLFRGVGDAPPPASGLTPGHVGWHELRAADGESAFAFYAGLFGWTKAEAIDIGPLGVYQLFATGGAAVGGMMTRMDPAIPPSWLYYLSVGEINAAVTRVEASGGTVLHGPQQVPGGNWIVQAQDPQGGLFALMAPGA